MAIVIVAPNPRAADGTGVSIAHAADLWRWVAEMNAAMVGLGEGAEGPDVTVFNPNEVIYVKGDADTDGSLRLVPDVIDPTVVAFEIRTSGIWNLTGIEIAASTLHLGREVLISGHGDWIKQSDLDGDVQALIPHHEYEDASGSIPYAHTPILGPLLPGDIIQLDDSVDTGAVTSFRYVQPPVTRRMISSFWWKNGATVATAPIKVTVARNDYASGTGTVIYQHTYTAAHLSGGTNDVVLTGWLEFVAGKPIYVEIESEGGTFSLLVNASGLQPWKALSHYDLTEENLVTFETGLDQVITSCVDGTVMADSNGNLLTLGAP